MNIQGELIALIVAVSWTATAIFAEIATKRHGTIIMNVLRMGLSIVLLALLLLAATGSPIPTHTTANVWMWFGLSGFVGYVFGDYCLFKSYTLIGSRFGQLFMTLSSLFATIAAYLMLSEKISLMAAVGMVVTITGISISVLNKGAGEHKLQLKLPWQGIVLGLGASIGQGVGLVLSKIGMMAYKDALAGISETDMSYQMMPFAGTMIRGIVGFLGFVLMFFLFGKISDMRKSLRDRKFIVFATLATIFGPFIGVSLSLLSVSYTSTGIAQTIMSITPVLILLPAYLVFKQKITPLEILGALISVAGVSLFFQ